VEHYNASYDRRRRAFSVPDSFSPIYQQQLDNGESSASPMSIPPPENGAASVSVAIKEVGSSSESSSSEDENGPGEEELILGPVSNEFGNDLARSIFNGPELLSLLSEASLDNGEPSGLSRRRGSSSLRYEYRPDNEENNESRERSGQQDSMPRRTQATHGDLNEAREMQQTLRGDQTMSEGRGEEAVLQKNKSTPTRKTEDGEAENGDDDLYRAY